MNQISRRTMLGTVGAVGAAGVVGATVAIRSGSDAEAEAVPAAEPADRRVVFHSWEGAEGFEAGAHEGTAVDDSGQLVIASPTETIDYTDPHTDTTRSYDVATWTAPETALPFGATQVIPSWNATTPTGTWVEVGAQAVTGSGQSTDWYVLARWARGDGDEDIQRSTLDGQEDQHAAVYTDLLAALGETTFANIRVRVRLHRIAGGTQTPQVALVSSMSSALPADETVPVSEPGDGAGIVLEVPTYSQHLHSGHYPQWNGGGQAWCSPTCTAMVLDYWDLGPTESETDWVDIEGEDRPQVDHLARYVFDYTYGGAGNWAFNAAYAGERGARAYITQLRSLVEAEQFIKAGIPLIVSMSFTEDELDGAGYGTNGHLMTLVGFDDNGDPVTNDPASQDQADDEKVRITYRRDQFENVWLPRSGGIAYVITPPGQELPAADADESNWG